MTDLTILEPEHSTRQGFSLVDEDLTVVDGLDRDQAEYAKTLLDEGALGDLKGLDRWDVAFLVEQAVEYVENHAGDIVFRAETREWAL